MGCGTSLGPQHDSVTEAGRQDEPRANTPTHEGEDQAEVHVLAQLNNAQASDRPAAAARASDEGSGTQEFAATEQAVNSDSQSAAIHEPLDNSDSNIQSQTTAVEVERQHVEASIAPAVEPEAGGNESEGSVREPTLRIARPIGFKQIYNDRSTGAKMDGSIWKPVAPEGFFILGFYSENHYQPPEKVVCVADFWQDADENRVKPLAAPTHFELAWSNRGAWFLKRNKASLELSIYVPVAPQDFVAVGCVCVLSHSIVPKPDDPSFTSVRCVHRSLVRPATLDRLCWQTEGQRPDIELSLWAATSSAEVQSEEEEKGASAGVESASWVASGCMQIRTDNARSRPAGDTAWVSIREPPSSAAAAAAAPSSESGRTTGDGGGGGRVAGKWTDLRCFVSSTFVDQHGERDALVKRVMPMLNERLRREERWVRVTPIDLRWGVLPDQVSRIQQTCLNEIDACVSPPAVERAALSDRRGVLGRPWFIALRGERYGWVQDQYAPPEDFTKTERVQRWMQGLVDREKKVSITSMEVYHALLAFSSNVDVGSGNQHHGAGIVGPGLVHGFAYFRDATFKQSLQPDLQWVFDFDFVQRGSESSLPPGTELQYTAVDNCDEIKGDMAEINAQIRQATDVVVCRDYAPSSATVEITGQLPSGKKFGVGTCLGLQEFESMVYKDLYAALDREFPPLAAALDPSALERVMHETVLDARASFCFGRDVFLADLVAFALERRADEATGRAGVVWGDPGAGKSCIMAKLYTELRNHLCGADGSDRGFVFVHVVSATASSFRVRDLLSRLCGDLIAHFGLLMEVEEGLSELRFQLPEVLAEVARRGAGGRHDFRLCVLIDAVNQMSSEGGAHTLNWLPLQALPQSVTILLSTLPHAVLDSARSARGSLRPVEFNVPPLARESREQLVEAFLAKHNKRLSRDVHDKLLGSQMDLLLDKRSGTSPLYLLAACEVLVIFGGVYERMTTFMRDLEHDVPSLFRQLLGLLETEHGLALVRTTMSLVACSPSGLMEMEMIELLEGGWGDEEEEGAQAEDVAGQSNFSRLYACSKMFLSGSAGAGMLQFFHDQLLFVVRSRYGLLPPKLSNKTLCRTHLVLGNYFWSKLAHQCSPSFEHAVSVCPQHLLHAGWPRLCQLLPSLSFLQSRARLHMLPLLTQELVIAARILRACSPSQTVGAALEFQDMGGWNPDGNEQDPLSIATGEGSEVVWAGAGEGVEVMVEAIAFVRKEGANLSTWPSLTVQIALNQREGSLPNRAAQTVLDARESRGGDGGESGGVRDGNSHRDLESSWGEGVPMELDLPARLFRQVNKEEGESDVVSVLKGHTHYVVDLDFGGDADGLVVSASMDSTLKVWEVETGAEKAVLRGHRGPVTSCMLFGHGRFVVSGGEDGTVRGWDARTGFELCVVNLTTEGEGAGGVSGVRCIDEEGWVGVSCLSGTMALLQTRQLTSGTADDAVVPLVLHQDDDDPVLACDLYRTHSRQEGTPRELAAWGLKSGVLVTWNIEENDSGGSLGGTCSLGAVVSSVAFVRGVGEGLIAAGTHGHDVHVISLQSMNVVQTLSGFGWVYRLRCSPTGTHLLVGSRSKTPALLGAYSDSEEAVDPESWQWEIAGRLIWHQSFVTAVAFSEGGAYWATGSEDKAIVLWKNRKRSSDLPPNRQGRTAYGGELICHSQMCTRTFVLQEARPSSDEGDDVERVRGCVVVSFSNGNMVAVHDARKGQEWWRHSLRGGANNTVPFAYMLPLTTDSRREKEDRDDDEEEDEDEDEDEEEEGEDEEEDGEDDGGTVIRLGWGMVGGSLTVMDIRVNHDAEEGPVTSLREEEFSGVCRASVSAVGRVWLGGVMAGEEALVCGDEHGSLTLSQVQINDDEDLELFPLFGMEDDGRVGHAPGCRVSTIEAVDGGGETGLGTFVTGGDDDSVRVWMATSSQSGEGVIYAVCVIDGHRNLITRALGWWVTADEEEERPEGVRDLQTGRMRLAVASSSMDRRVRLALVSGWEGGADAAHGEVVWVDAGIAHKDGVSDMAMVKHDGRRLLVTASLEGLVKVHPVALRMLTTADGARVGVRQFGAEVCSVSSVSEVTSCAVLLDEEIAGQTDHALRQQLWGWRLVLGLKSGEVLVHVL